MVCLLAHCVSAKCKGLKVWYGFKPASTWGNTLDEFCATTMTCISYLSSADFQSLDFKNV